MTGRSDIKPHEWLIEHDAKRQHQQTAYHEAKQRFEQTRQHFEQQNRRLDQLKHQHQHTEQHQQQIDGQIQNWLKPILIFRHLILRHSYRLIQHKSKTFVTVLIMPSVY